MKPHFGAEDDVADSVHFTVNNDGWEAVLDRIGIQFWYEGDWVAVDPKDWGRAEAALSDYGMEVAREGDEFSEEPMNQHVESQARQLLSRLLESGDVTGEEASTFYRAFAGKYGDLKPGQEFAEENLVKYDTFMKMSQQFGEREFSTEAQEAFYQILPHMAAAYENGR